MWLSQRGTFGVVVLNSKKKPENAGSSNFFRAVLQKSSHLTQNSSFLIPNTSFLIHVLTHENHGSAFTLSTQRNGVSQSRSQTAHDVGLGKQGAAGLQVAVDQDLGGRIDGVGLLSGLDELLLAVELRQFIGDAFAHSFLALLQCLLQLDRRRGHESAGAGPVEAESRNLLVVDQTELGRVPAGQVARLDHGGERHVVHVSRRPAWQQRRPPHRRRRRRSRSRSWRRRDRSRSGAGDGDDALAARQHAAGRVARNGAPTGGRSLEAAPLAARSDERPDLAARVGAAFGAAVCRRGCFRGVGRGQVVTAEVGAGESAPARSLRRPSSID